MNEQTTKHDIKMVKIKEFKKQYHQRRLTKKQDEKVSNSRLKSTNTNLNVP